MSNTQLFLAMGVPILVALIGLVWNNRSNHAEVALLRAEMNGKFDVVNVQLATIARTLEVIQQDLKQFHEVTSSLDKRVLTLANKQQ